MKQNRKKGFSMVEMIVVVAIMGVFTALATIGFGYLKSENVRPAVKTVDSNLTKLKLDTMSKENKPYMCIYKVGSDYYMLCTTDSNISPNASNGQKIGNGNVKISVGGVELTGSSKIYIAFKKGSGAFTDKITIGSVENSTVTTSSDSTIAMENASGTGTKYTLHMIRDTGKHYIEQN